MLRVIVCRPDEYAKVTWIEDSLEAMQGLVGGLIEPYDPFYSDSDPRYENVILVCNEEGKLRQMKPSRAIIDEDGRVMDVIAGPFFLCYSPVESESFESLPADLEEVFMKKYEKPEHIFRKGNEYSIVRYDPGKSESEQER
ncbi:MAG: hypothetical protein BZ136_09195 [Methanosphaera sp. rholeuAM74]|nr:MAG: hypothetical protein BZ136_09195 [Methanosphaera sp. rholeuAM74]